MGEQSVPRAFVSRVGWPPVDGIVQISGLPNLERLRARVEPSGEKAAPVFWPGNWATQVRFLELRSIT
ncbi:MAG: hypothetical protein EBZ78_01940 [Verrucomicrobia bacterium]|nr:hypothetical protein [Verrucomicrobiota bacterium]